MVAGQIESRSGMDARQSREQHGATGLSEIRVLYHQQRKIPAALSGADKQIPLPREYGGHPRTKPRLVYLFRCNLTSLLISDLAPLRKRSQIAGLLPQPHGCLD